MKITRLRLLFAVLLVGVAAWGVLLWIERLYREPENYSLIEDGLYMGGSVEEPPPGTQAVLNLCEFEDPYRAEVHYWKPIRDAAPAPTLKWLRRAVEFVDAKRRAGMTVYVHCFQGKSRAGLVVTAYEMYRHKWARDQALAYIRSRRPQVRPNRAFMALLQEWEEAVQEKAAEPTEVKPAP